MRTVGEPSRVSRRELEDVIEFWDDRSADRRTTVEDVRRQLDAIQRFFDRHLFERDWKHYPEILREEGFEILYDDENVVLVRDERNRWHDVFRVLDGIEATDRKILRLIHARLGTRLFGGSVDRDVLVVEKPEWLDVAERIDHR
jgi:hypothetical protein